MITPKPRLTPAQIREMADVAGCLGRSATPMSSARRALNYDRQNGVPSRLTPAQYRRWQHKFSRINDPAGSRGGDSR